MDELPSEYSYIHVPNEKCTTCFRIKEVTNKESVQAWVKRYSDETKTTWRIRRTFPSCGKLNLYKIEYRCCHFTDRRSRGTGPSKHTGCTAKIVITINRYIENSECNLLKMQLIESHPCLVLLYNEHNHDVNSAESLKHRDLLPAVREQFIDLFYKGHGPTSALKAYKTSLMLELGNEYHTSESDRRIMPTYSMVHKMFERVFPKTYKEDRTVVESLPPSPNALDGKVDEVFNRLAEFCNKLMEKVRDDPEVFLPAAEKMLDNSDKMTDTDLLSAMYIFGNYSGMTQNVSKTILRRCHKNATGAQKTAVARRRGCSPGKKRIGVGKPRSQTSNTSSPNKKRKASFDFETCLYDDNS